MKTAIKLRFHALKYAAILTAIGFGIYSLHAGGLWTFALPIYVFGLLPLLELILPADDSNLDEAELALVKKDWFYDFLLYLMVPVQYGLLVYFLFAISNPEISTLEMIGRTFTLGITCSVLGINVGHELGHRSKKYEQFLSKSLLLTSLYMHFFIEHNRGHHKNVSTDEVPASSRRGENLYGFWLRSVVNGYLSAWKIENGRLRRKGKQVISLENEMLRFQVIQFAFVGVIWLAFGWKPTLLFLVAATIGFLLLETVNYIEHYGLRREKNEKGYYERVRPQHSWNSNHVLGRIMLFELSRHSDHHAHSGRKYQVLRHMDGAPQMPTGYPGMVMLAFVPPLWFWVMHRHIDRYNAPSAVEMAT